MLFDLRGRRRHAVQAIYLVLALLMGGGLVFFGIGGDVSGGLLNAFEGGGGNSGNDAVEQRIDKNEERLQRNPKAAVALKELVRDNYQLAASRIPENAAAFPPEAQADLQRAATYWERYLGLEDEKPDVSLAALAGQLYGPGALNKPKQAQEAYRIIAQESNDVESYLQLVQAATIAGDTRTADLAGVKAIDLAPKAQRGEIEKQVKQIKRQAKAQAQAATPPPQN